MKSSQSKRKLMDFEARTRIQINVALTAMLAIFSFTAGAMI